MSASANSGVHAKPEGGSLSFVVAEAMLLFLTSKYPGSDGLKSTCLMRQPNIRFPPIG
jgi:hypothetical protein